MTAVKKSAKCIGKFAVQTFARDDLLSEHSFWREMTQGRSRDVHPHQQLVHRTLTQPAHSRPRDGGSRSSSPRGTSLFRTNTTMKKLSKAAVVVLPSSALPSGDDSPSDQDHTTSLSRIEFPDDINGASLVPLFVLRKNSKPVMVAEIVRFSSPYGSWFFVPESQEEVPEVCSNGNMTIVTAVDPLFCALVLMDSRRAVGEKQVFQPLDALCVTSDGTNLNQFCDATQFGMLCDVKEAAGQSFYRLSDDKTMSWLLAKHKALGKHPNMKPQDAVEVISQYVTSKWSKQLRKKLLADVDNVDTEAHEAAKKAQNLAIAIMMEDAIETNEARRTEERDRNRGSFTPAKKKAAAKSKVKKKEKAPEASFWVAREKSLAAKGTRNGLKRTRSSSSTK